MNTPITQQIQAIEQAYKQKLEKPLHFEAEMMQLKLMIRQYAKERGIE